MVGFVQNKGLGGGGSLASHHVECFYGVKGAD